VLKIEGNFSRLRARLAHLVGHLPPGLRILEAREADVATCFVPPKEVGEGAMEAFERDIHDHSRQIRMSLFAMPLVLLIQVQIGARLFVNE